MVVQPPEAALLSWRLVSSPRWRWLSGVTYILPDGGRTQEQGVPGGYASGKPLLCLMASDTAQTLMSEVVDPAGERARLLLIAELARRDERDRFRSWSGCVARVVCRIWEVPVPGPKEEAAARARHLELVQARREALTRGALMADAERLRREVEGDARGVSGRDQPWSPEMQQVLQATEEEAQRRSGWMKGQPRQGRFGVPAAYGPEAAK